jgi:hypothetical protein
MLSYLIGNALHLRYRAQPVNAVWGNSRCLLWEPYWTHKCGVCVCGGGENSLNVELGGSYRIQCVLKSNNNPKMKTHAMRVFLHLLVTMAMYSPCFACSYTRPQLKETLQVAWLVWLRERKAPMRYICIYTLWWGRGERKESVFGCCGDWCLATGQTYSTRQRTPLTGW